MKIIMKIDILEDGGSSNLQHRHKGSRRGRKALLLLTIIVVKPRLSDSIPQIIQVGDKNVATTALSAADNPCYRQGVWDGSSFLQLGDNNELSATVGRLTRD